MNTKIYNVWAPKVIELIKSITTSTEQYDAVDKWLDDEGATVFRVGQQDFFIEHKEKFQNTTHVISEELFKLTKDQVLAGFNRWFNTLITHFPGLDTEIVRSHFTTFKSECINECYDALFAIRMVITCKHAQGKLTDPKLYLLEWERLIEAGTDAIISFNEQRNKAPQKYSFLNQNGAEKVQQDVVECNPSLK